MAVHGVARSTQDLDVLTMAADCLEPPFWNPLRLAGVDVEIRRGPPDDPLAGVVRCRTPADPPIDVVVGKSAWQASVIARAADTEIEGVRVPVARAADLILLKLYAGGPQDAWDVEQLLAGPDREELVAAVERAVDALPVDSRQLWARIRGSAERA
jgi:hypothetical protein